MKMIAIVIVLALTGCASYRPIVDLRPGQSAQGYELALQECQRHAEQVSPATHAVAGAVAGAGLSALLATVGGRGFDRGASTRVGAVLGAASGGGEGAQAQRMIIINCLRGRGFNALY